MKNDLIFWWQKWPLLDGYAKKKKVGSHKVADLCSHMSGISQLGEVKVRCRNGLLSNAK